MMEWVRNSSRILNGTIFITIAAFLGAEIGNDLVISSVKVTVSIGRFNLRTFGILLVLRFLRILRFLIAL